MEVSCAFLIERLEALEDVALEFEVLVDIVDELDTVSSFVVFENVPPELSEDDMQSFLYLGVVDLELKILRVQEVYLFKQGDLLNQYPQLLAVLTVHEVKVREVNVLDVLVDLIYFPADLSLEFCLFLHHYFF